MTRPEAIMLRYPEDELQAELVLLGWHLHWTMDDLLDLSHRDRVRLVTDVLRMRATAGG